MIEGRAAASESTRSHTDAPLPLVLRWLRTIGFIEGVSTLMLFGIAMPLKYAADIPIAVTVAGSVHGGLFMVYLATILWVMVVYRWPLFRGVALLAASILPFGPFVMDRRIPRWHASDAWGKGRAPEIF